jgi:hypothetical protein
MLNQSVMGPESGRILVINKVAMNGKNPNTRFNILYFPVRCIIHLKLHSEISQHGSSNVSYPANIDPMDIDTLLGSRCRPAQRVKLHNKSVNIRENAPASEALVSITVWNHIGKKYVMAKLQFATRKLLMPTSTGIFCFSRNGASIGSAAKRSSQMTNTRNNTSDSTNGTMTVWSLICTTPASLNGSVAHQVRDAPRVPS